MHHQRTASRAAYLGDDKFLEAAPPRDGDSIRVSELNNHGKPCTKVRRIFG